MDNMEIAVLGQVIETKNITCIYEIERDKKMFLNREAGFVIMFMDGSQKVFKENIPYESYRSEIAYKKEKWAKLQKEVTEKWEQDKHNLQEFGFDVKPSAQTLPAQGDDESASSSNEDYVPSSSNSSNTACDAPFKDNNSNQQ